MSRNSPEETNDISNSAKELLNSIINDIKQRAIENAAEYDYFKQYFQAAQSIEFAAKCTQDHLFW